jgi:hypothetical protein
MDIKFLSSTGGKEGMARTEAATFREVRDQNLLRESETITMDLSYKNNGLNKDTKKGLRTEI